MLIKSLRGAPNPAESGVRGNRAPAGQRRGEAISTYLPAIKIDCFASLAMTEIYLFQQAAVSAAPRGKFSYGGQNNAKSDKRLDNALLDINIIE